MYTNQRGKKEKKNGIQVDRTKVTSRSQKGRKFPKRENIHGNTLRMYILHKN